MLGIHCPSGSPDPARPPFAVPPGSHLRLPCDLGLVTFGTRMHVHEIPLTQPLAPPLSADVDIIFLQNPFEHLHRDSDVEGMTDGWDNGTACELCLCFSWAVCCICACACCYGGAGGRDPTAGTIGHRM